MDERTDLPRILPTAPTGGVPLTEERLREVAAQWEQTRRALRAMDDADLGETEPATIFAWRTDER